MPVAICALALAAAGGASPEKQVQFEIEVTGKGTVTAEWGAGAYKRRVECRASCTRPSTVTTFSVTAGTVVLKAWAAQNWEFMGWTRACLGS
ncbi:MAG: hypothetical protein ACRDOF_08075, partial [Gaiellaceae bacterium]